MKRHCSVTKNAEHISKNETQMAILAVNDKYAAELRQLVHRTSVIQNQNKKKW